jgi:hypothetical protein
MLNISQAINNWYLKQIQSSHSLSFFKFGKHSFCPDHFNTYNINFKKRVNVALFKFVNHGS